MLEFELSELLKSLASIVSRLLQIHVQSRFE